MVGGGGGVMVGGKSRGKVEGRRWASLPDMGLVGTATAEKASRSRV